MSRQTLQHIPLIEWKTGITQKLPFGVNTTIELKNITTSENTGTLLSKNVARKMPLLSDLIVLFFSSVVVSTANKQSLDCATIEFSGAYSISWGMGGGSFMRN